MEKLSIERIKSIVCADPVYDIKPGPYGCEVVSLDSAYESFLLMSGFTETGRHVFLTANSVIGNYPSGELFYLKRYLEHLMYAYPEIESTILAGWYAIAGINAADLIPSPFLLKYPFSEKSKSYYDTHSMIFNFVNCIPNFSLSIFHKAWDLAMHVFADYNKRYCRNSYGNE